jgi:hypothetical protein
MKKKLFLIGALCISIHSTHAYNNQYYVLRNILYKIGFKCCETIGALADRPKTTISEIVRALQQKYPNQCPGNIANLMYWCLSSENPPNNQNKEAICQQAMAALDRCVVPVGYHL